MPKIVTTALALSAIIMMFLTMQIIYMGKWAYIDYHRMNSMKENNQTQELIQYTSKTIEQNRCLDCWLHNIFLTQAYHKEYAFDRLIEQKKHNQVLDYSIKMKKYYRLYIQSQKKLTTQTDLFLQQTKEGELALLILHATQNRDISEEYEHFKQRFAGLTLDPRFIAQLKKRYKDNPNRQIQIILGEIQ